MAEHYYYKCSICHVKGKGIGFKSYHLRIKMGYKCAKRWYQWCTSRLKIYTFKMPLTNCPKHTNQHRAKHHRNNPETMNDRYQDPAIFNYNRHSQAVEHERGAQVCVKVGHYVVCDESVDEVAEEYIKLRHKKFELSKSMSTKAGWLAKALLQDHINFPIILFWSLHI